MEYFAFFLIVVVSLPVLLLTYAVHYVAKSMLEGDEDE